jgi:hypothetical protein
MKAKDTVILAAGRRLIMRLAAWLEDPRDADANGQSWLLTGHWALVMARLGRGKESGKRLA